MAHGSIPRYTEAVSQLSQREPTVDAEQIVNGLGAGLSLLRARFYRRIHFDVEENVGKDSMFVPLSERRAYEETREVIDVYQVVESAWAAGEFGSPAAGDDWYLGWLGEFWIGERVPMPEISKKLARYQRKSPDARRSTFMDDLLKVLPESSKSPLILYRLFPAAIHIATAIAFGNHQGARELRAQQAACLPVIKECSQCYGTLLENGETCAACGNPLWKYQWLTVTD